MCFKVRVDISISLHSLRRIEFKTCCHKQRYKYCTRLMLPYQIRGFWCNTFLPIAFVGLIAESSVFLSSLYCCCREVRYTRVQQIATPTFCFWGGGFLSSSVLPVVACSVTTREQGAIFAASILRFEKLLPPARIFRRLRFISDGSVDQRSACACVCACLCTCSYPAALHLFFYLLFVWREREPRGLLRFLSEGHVLPWQVSNLSFNLSARSYRNSSSCL